MSSLFVLLIRKQRFAELFGQELIQAHGEVASDVLVEVGILKGTSQKHAESPAPYTT